MDWFDQDGGTMEVEQWTDAAHRTLQYVAASVPENGETNRILLIVHGTEAPIDVRLPESIEGATAFVQLWSSADETPSDEQRRYAPGDVLPVQGTSMRLFRVE